AYTIIETFAYLYRFEIRKGYVKNDKDIKAEHGSETNISGECEDK
ncbi:7104_t:CDS:2, partial [Racocetra fulgida]